MTVLKGGRHSWAPAFCTGCKSIVHYQADDVIEAPAITVARGIGNARRGVVWSIVCKCETRIEIAHAP